MGASRTKLPRSPWSRVCFRIIIAIPHLGSFLSILIPWYKPANLPLSVLFLHQRHIWSKANWNDTSYKTLHFYHYLLIRKRMKRGGVCSAANEREPEVFVDSDARLWDAICQSSKVTWGEVKSRCHIGIPPSRFCMCDLHKWCKKCSVLQFKGCLTDLCLWIFL